MAKSEIVSLSSQNAEERPKKKRSRGEASHNSMVKNE